MRTSIHAPSSHHQPANRHSKSETAISRAPKRAMSGCNVTQEHTKPNATRHAFVGDLKMLTLSTNSDGRGRPMTPAREDDNVAQEKGNSLVCALSARVRALLLWLYCWRRADHPPETRVTRFASLTYILAIRTEFYRYSLWHLNPWIFPGERHPAPGEILGLVARYARGQGEWTEENCVMRENWGL